jgi:peptide/nickel transport system permease protein
MPGDPRASMIADNMPPDTIAALARKFGLDRPLIEQFFLYLINLFQGDLGLSFSHASEPVWETIFDFRFRNTFILMGSSLIVSILIGMVVGVIAASRRGSKVDTGSTVFFLVAYSMPVFWVGLLILLYFGFHMQLIPLAGTITRGADHANFLVYAADYLHHMMGPLIVLSLSFVGGFYLIMRDTVLDVFTQDYILAAEAKGLKERTILYGHAMRNAMLPMVSVIAVNLPYVISGATMTEYVFSWSGIGLLTYDSVLAADYPVLQGIFLFLATITLIANFIADVLYLYLDPRIRY